MDAAHLRRHPADGPRPPGGDRPVGDALFPAAYVGRDATYPYVPYRVDQTPPQHAWVHPKQDTSLQLSDASGTLFCTTIPAGRFRHTQRLVFAFTDRTARAVGGLERVEFRINRRGNLLFRARGRGVDLRSVVGGSVRVTLRVGNACARTTMALRTSRKGLVFP